MTLRRRQGDRAFPGNGRAVSDEARVCGLGTQGRSTDRGERPVTKSCVGSRRSHAQSEIMERVHNLLGPPDAESERSRRGQEALQGALYRSGQLLRGPYGFGP